VFNQTLSPDEVVLVEDGPLTDELYDAIAKYPQLKTVKLAKNGGLGKALNEGLKHCSFDLVVRMDSDDISKSDRFEKQVKFMEENPTIDVVSAWLEEFVDDKSNVVTLKKLPETDIEIKKLARKRSPINHAVAALKKSAVQNAGGYIHFPLFEDYYLWARMILNGAKFYNIQESLYLCRISEDMFKRRGGWKYGCDEIRLQNKFLSMKFITFPRYLYNIAIRFSVRIMPNFLREFVYKKFLR
jgi:glycosyltransferase involved in cell wall biosynthesis